jgi:cytochrome P450
VPGDNWQVDLSADLGALSTEQSDLARAHTGMSRSTQYGAKALTLSSLIEASNMVSLPIRAARTLKSTTSHISHEIDQMIVLRELSNKQSSANGKESQDDLVDILIASRDLSHEHVLDQSLHYLRASSVMPSITTSWTLHLLSRHPEVQSRLRAEGQEHLNQASPDPEKLDALPYLNAVLEETLRVHHLDTILWRETLDPKNLAGHSIHAGIKIVWSPWVLIRDPQYSSADADVFGPDKWLEGPLDEKRSDPGSNGQGRLAGQFSNISFGIGPRRCIGELSGRAVVKCMVAGLVGRVEFSPKRRGGVDECRIGSRHQSSYSPFQGLRWMDGSCQQRAV